MSPPPARPKYSGLRIRPHAHQLLRLIAAATTEDIMDVVERLATDEWDRLYKRLGRNAANTIRGAGRG